MRHSICRFAKYLWASPNTVLGAGFGLGVILLGGRARIVSGVIEFSGGALGHIYASAPIKIRFRAITFGHVIVGVNARELANVRLHEHVHVRQYERWGPFFLPAYLLSSMWQGLQGRRVYRDNVFEVEAYAAEDIKYTGCTRLP